MPARHLLAAGLLLLVAPLRAQGHFPPPGEAWKRRDARGAGFDPEALAEAVKFTQAQLAVDALRSPGSFWEYNSVNRRGATISGSTRSTTWW